MTGHGELNTTARQDHVAQAQVVDVSQLIDERGITRFHVGLLAFAFLILLIDGHDISALAFAIPSLVNDWQITDQSALGPGLGASLLGMLIGAPALGALGNRVGRKLA